MAVQIAIFTLLFLLMLIVFYLFLRSEISKLQVQKSDPALMEWLKSMQSTMDSSNKNISEAMRSTTSDVSRLLSTNTKQLNERLDTAAHVIGELKRNLGEMSEVGRGIKSLQEFLQSPKLRGNIGEEVLSDMIGQTFPRNSFHLQYQFKSGAKVDAVLKTDAGLLCIDAKFPMANFTRIHNGETQDGRQKAEKEFLTDVKKHIADISRKYILPEEGTLEFALMYIPSEAVYYEIINNEDITRFARNSKIYPVSPNTLYAHLQVLLVSFQGKQMQEKSREIFRLLQSIQKDYSRIEEGLSVLNKHVTNAFNSVNSVNSSFQLLGQKLDKTHLLEGKD